ncbi:hypothetical protein Q5762_06620 [Streptomyces sp. P9(2023)]|uniref:hypothetical protein n=1 Tax=Streptomyces sp. P9(2023) TaxID=3064394 RepID=UPI0028F3FC45|nr:hypothetical protein [Streptomyces sp. P9(2023)]MDT9688027.1 hypothetical protein [Streptomyces sp. P9(2023)]
MGRRATFRPSARECLDFNTGLRSSRLVVRVPCGGVHDGRVLGQHTLAGEYPGCSAAQDRAGRACTGSGTGERTWYTWSTAWEWRTDGKGRATCYSVTGG